VFPEKQNHNTIVKITKNKKKAKKENIGTIHRGQLKYA
jgi:hypothetical protein